MDINSAGATAGDASSSTPTTGFTQLTASASQSFQHFLDKMTPHLLYRWIAFVFIAILLTRRSKIYPMAQLCRPEKLTNSALLFVASLS